MLSGFITACKSLKQMMPEGPAISDKERSRYLDQKQHNVSYTGKALVDFPVNPIQVWAATYELDIILVSKHPDWNMHEYAKLETPEGPLWIMKDAKEPTLDQYIVADLDNLEAWLPELPVVRKSYPVTVADNSTDKMLDLTFRYENIAGQKVEATYQGKPPKTEQKKKNGSTMGHSRNQLLVGLNLPYRDFGKKASISYDGKPYKIDKLLGLVPFQMALQQTQGGASMGAFSLKRESTNKLVSSHENGEKTVKQDWNIIENDNQTILRQENSFRTAEYTYIGIGETLELKSASIQQWNKSKKGVKITFSPTLPDLRRPFEGAFVSNFVMDIEGQNNNAIGTVTAQWIRGEAVLSVTPVAPWWVADRPMQTTINYNNTQNVKINIEMLPLIQDL